MEDFLKQLLEIDIMLNVFIKAMNSIYNKLEMLFTFFFVSNFNC